MQVLSSFGLTGKHAVVTGSNRANSKAIAPDYIAANTTEALRNDPTGARPSWGAFRQDAGVILTILKDQPFFWPLPHPIMYTAPFSPSTAAGWGDEQHVCGW